MYADRNHESHAPSPGWNDEPSRAAVFEQVDDAVYTTDPDGWLTYYNEAAADLWGYRPELGKTRWCGSWRVYTPDGAPLPLDRCPMAVALEQGRDVRGVQAVLERPDGTLVPFTPYPTLLRDASGRVVAGSNMLVRLTRLTPPVIPDLCDHEPAAISPIDFEAAVVEGNLTGCLQWTLAALADVELAFQADCDRLGGWTGSSAEQDRIRGQIESRREKQREPLIRILEDIHDHAQPIMLDGARAKAVDDIDIDAAIEIIKRSALA